jgi:putative ABC transport system permease protein
MMDGSKLTVSLPFNVYRLLMIPFSITMAWRETRASWPRFVFFFICIAIGVGAIVGVGLFATNVEQYILRDARSLLGGDLEISTRRQLSETGHEIIASLQPRGIAISHVSELAAMAAAQDPSVEPHQNPPATQLVELKAVDPSYPYYGTVEVDPPQPLSTLLTPSESQCDQPPCYGAIVQESLLISLNLEPGSELKIGQALFTITGILIKEPDRVASAFSLGPRIIISRDGLKATDLVKPGSRIRERFLLRVPESQALQPLLGELRGRFSQEGARVLTYRDAQPRIRRFLDHLSTYLGLIGLTVLFVGGIGVATTVQGFLSQKMTIIAILKTVGADARQIMRTYLFQSLIMGSIGSVLGAGLGISLQMVLPLLLKDLLPSELTFHLSFIPILKGMTLGILSSAVFTLWPLMSIRHIPPALVFRRDIDASRHIAKPETLFRRMPRILMAFLQDRSRVAIGLLIGTSLTGLAIWQARSLTLGLFFMAAFVLALLLLFLASRLLLRLLVTLPRSRSFTIRNALSNLGRPGNYTMSMTVAIGIGVMVIVSIAVIKNSLLASLGERLPSNSPSFFFIDIQPDQRASFEDLLAQWVELSDYELTPVVRSRLSAIDGHPVDPEAYRGQRNGWYFTRSYVLTSLIDLPNDNTIVDGEWWKDSGQVGVSVEDEAAKNLGLDIGSTLEFDIQGAPLPTRVESTRKVDWSSFSTNFFMILSPNALDGVPMTYIATARVSKSEEVPLQRALVAALPNITAINVGDVLHNISNLLQQLAWAIQGIALLCIGNGAIVMIAALSTTRYRRVYEAAILKALGGTRGVIARSLALEFGVLGGFAGLIGITLASTLSWFVLRFFLDLDWSVQPLLLVTSFLLTILLTLAIGFLSTFRLLSFPPLAVLRQE